MNYYELGRQEAWGNFFKEAILSASAMNQAITQRTIAPAQTGPVPTWNTGGMRPAALPTVAPAIKPMGPTRASMRASLDRTVAHGLAAKEAVPPLERSIMNSLGQPTQGRYSYGSQRE